MRFNTATDHKPLIRPARDVRWPVYARKNTEAASVASVCTRRAVRNNRSIINKSERLPLAGNMSTKTNRSWKTFEEMNFEILEFKNQMIHFIFCLRPVYLARTITVDRCTFH